MRLRYDYLIVEEDVSMFGDKLHNWDFIGRCYNVLTVDPIKIDHTATFKMAFQITEDDFEPTPDGTAKKPTFTDYAPSTGGSVDSRTVSLSSAYDFQSFNKVARSVEVSDPTGSLFSSTLSTTFAQTREETESRSRVETYTQQVVNKYRLSMRVDDFLLQLSPDLVKAVSKLPTTRTEKYRSFVETFGTHYARTVDFGGRVVQRLTVDEADYSKFLEEQIDVEAQARLTFNIAKAGGKIEGQDKRSDKFTRATKNSTDNIIYAGGTPQQFFDMWATTVAELPAPIRIVLCPLYELLVPRFLPDELEIGTKAQLLKEEIDDYMKSKGNDVRGAILQFGDQIVVRLQGDADREYYLSANTPKYVRTSQPSAPGNPGSDDFLNWIIVHADDPAKKGKVKVGDIIALRSVRTGHYLDAQAGTDEQYDAGDGLTAASAARTSDPPARWKVVLADRRDREEIVDGDQVRFRSQWQDAEGDHGFLMGDPQDSAQRVFSFGKASEKRRSIWRISRPTDGHRTPTPSPDV
jgi:hypothetical protein